MTTRYKTKAFIFKKNDVNDADRVFSVLTEDFGRLEIFGKAIRKNTSKLRGGIDLFYFSEIEFIQGKNRKTLTDAVITGSASIVSDNLDKFSLANNLSEVLDVFIKGQEQDRETFNLVADFFDKISDPKTVIMNHELAFQYFFWNFISLQGYRLLVHNCAVCAEKLNPFSIYFSSREGGVICEKCSTVGRKAKKIDSNVVKVLRLALEKDWQILSRIKMDPFSQKLLQDISIDAMHSFCPS